MEPFIRKVNYYETDRMGIVHHSNYIRWFEEARVDWMDKAGVPYAKMEEQGLFSPVLAVSCEYKHPFKFGETAYIHLELTSMSHVKFSFAYKIYNKDEKLCITGTTAHCFVNGNGQPVALRRENPAFYEAFAAELKTE